MRLDKENIAEAFAMWVRTHQDESYGRLLASAYGASFHKPTDKGHWLEVMASLLKEKKPFNWPPDHKLPPGRVITNALLRMENAQGHPIPPFEQPSDDTSLWVLELPIASDDLRNGLNEIAQCLEIHRSAIFSCGLSDMRPVLHLSISAGLEVPLLLPGELIAVVAGIGAGIEVYLDGP